MKLYKYRSLENLWHVLDIIVNRRLFCAQWDKLNDPLEGWYETNFDSADNSARGEFRNDIGRRLRKYRIASLSADPNNFLLWSHYADGHKGVAIELEIPDGNPDLHKIKYLPFSVIFTAPDQINEDLKYIFSGKTPEWEYEKEYRIISTMKYIPLDSTPSRLLLGQNVDKDKEKLIRSLLSHRIEIVNTEVDRSSGHVRIAGEQVLSPSIWPDQ